MELTFSKSSRNYYTTVNILLLISYGSHLKQPLWYVMQCFTWNSKFYWSNEPSLTFCDIHRQSYSVCFNSKDLLVSAFLDWWLSVLKQPKDVTTRKTGFWQNAIILSEHWGKNQVSKDFKVFFIIFSIIYYYSFFGRKTF